MADRIPDPPTQDVYGITLKAAERRTMDDLKHVGVLTSEINLQTERLGLYWANRLLRDETDYVKENLQEVEILTKAAILAYGTCDLNFIPKPFYQYFLLMFRRLLSESFKKYAPASPITPEYYSKIGELLNKCMERTKKIDFIVDKSCPPMVRQIDQFSFCVVLYEEICIKMFIFFSIHLTNQATEKNQFPKEKQTIMQNLLNMITS